MFKIKLRITIPEEMTGGWLALDERCRLRLPERSELKAVGYFTDSAMFSVGESFARCHDQFRSRSVVEVSVPITWLSDGEVAEVDTTCGDYRVMPVNISERRAEVLAAGAWRRDELQDLSEQARKEKEAGERLVAEYHSALSSLEDDMSLR